MSSNKAILKVNEVSERAFNLTKEVIMINAGNYAARQVKTWWRNFESVDATVQKELQQLQLSARADSNVVRGHVCLQLLLLQHVQSALPRLALTASVDASVVRDNDCLQSSLHLLEQRKGALPHLALPAIEDCGVARGHVSLQS